MNANNSSQKTDLKDENLKDFLENVNLYVSKTFFYGKNLTPAELWIDEIEKFCKICRKEKPFRNATQRSGSRQIGLARTSGPETLKYYCVTCKSLQQFNIWSKVTENDITVEKYGQLPRQELTSSRYIEKFLKDDRENYTKANICLNYSYGIAAFSYFRRIIETNIYRLLDEIKSEAERSSSDKNILEAIEELKALQPEAPMSKRIKIANLALPEYLKLDGINPLGRLYQITSEGIHSLSDDECLNKAKQINECLEFLLQEIALKQEQRARFKVNLNAIKSDNSSKD